MVVRAPIAGIVIARKASVGMAVQRGGDPLVEIGDSSALWIVADVFERDLSHIRQGAKSRILFPAVDRQIIGRVTEVGAVVASGLRTTPVFLTVEAQGVSLRPGMYGRVEIDAADASFTLPVTAVLIKDGKEPVVYVQKDDMTFVRGRVVVAQPVEGRVQIVSGLSPGEKVVVHGALLLDGSADQLLIRSSLIVASIIPLALLTAFIGLQLIHLPANLISMGAVDFGILVDGAVVLVEHVLHEAQRQKPKRRRELLDLIIHSAVDVARPTFFAMAIIIAALIPVFTLQRVEGRIFRPLALTYSFALLGALVFALTLIPALCAVVLRPRDAEVREPKLLVQVMNAATDVEDVSGQLAALLGLPGWSPRAVGTLDAGAVSAEVDVLWETAQRRRPSLVALRQQQATARGGLFLARRERLPVPALSGGIQTSREVNGTSAFVGFSIPLPFFDHNQGAVAKATAQIDAADLLIQAGQGEARAEIEHAATVLRKRREALQTLEGSVSERVPTLRRMAEDAYREGSADILELLDANRSLRDFQLARVQQLEAVKLAEETVIGAAGLDSVEPVR